MRQNFLPYLFWVVGFFPAVIGFAQEKQPVLDYFGDDKGLHISSITDIRQDKTGFLWIATWEGLVRYDGHSFKYFRNIPGDSTTLAHNFIACLEEDAGGNIWAGLYHGGVCRYDRKSGMFRHYPFAEKLKLKPAPVTGLFFDRDGNLWLGVEPYGLIRLNPETGDLKRYDVVTAETAPHLSRDALAYSNTAYRFWQDDTGYIWCTTRDGLYRFDPKTGRATPCRPADFDPRDAEFRQTYSLLPDGDLFWMGGWSSGLQCYNRKTGSWEQYFFNMEYGKSGVTNIVDHIAHKNAEEIWIASKDRGLGIFNKKTKRFYFPAHDPDANPVLPKTDVGIFCIDRQGQLWLDVNDQLTRIQFKQVLFRFNPVHSKIPIPKYQAPVSALFEDRENRFLFIGLNTGDGLHIFDKSTGRIIVPDFPAPPDLLREDLRSVRNIRQGPDGAVWVLSRHALYRFNPDMMRLEAPKQPPLYSPEFKSNLYNQFDIDPAGNLWLSTSLSGVIRYNPATGSSAHFLPDAHQPGAIATNVVGAIAVDGKGRTWYGSRSKSAYGYYSPAENRFVYLDAEGQQTSEITTLSIVGFFADNKGDIWACTEQGLLHFDCSGAHPRLLKCYTTADGIPSDLIISATQDQQGRIWCQTLGSLCRLDAGTGKITVFGSREGFPKGMPGIGSMRDGALYVRGEYGYYLADPDSLQPYRSAAPIVLTSFKVDDREQYHGSLPVLFRPLVVTPDSRFFSLEFAALDFSQPESVHYEYRLEGYDDTWVNAGGRRFVNYTNIPPGHYFFKVKQAGASDREALSIPLVVEVAFYRTWWFWLMILAVLVAAGVRFARRRRAQERHVAELKSRTQLLEKEMAVVKYESLKQQLNPHFLFNSLTSLGSLIQIDPKAAARFLDNLSKSYRYILKSSERELVSLAEELKFMESFVQLQKTRFETGFEVHVNVPEEFFHRKIVPVTLQNLLENAIKHNIIDEETPLVVHVFVEGDCVVVRNNLQRKKFVETSNRRGLTHLQSFYQYLSDRHIETTDDGQFFTIKIPLI